MSQTKYEYISYWNTQYNLSFWPHGGNDEPAAKNYGKLPRIAEEVKDSHCGVPTFFNNR